MTSDTHNEYGLPVEAPMTPKSLDKPFEKGGVRDPEFWRQFNINRERIRQINNRHNPGNRLSDEGVPVNKSRGLQPSELNDAQTSDTLPELPTGAALETRQECIGKEKQ